MTTVPEAVEKAQLETTEPAPRGVKAVLKKVRSPRQTTPPSAIDRLMGTVKVKRPKADVKFILKTFEMAESAHDG